MPAYTIPNLSNACTVLRFLAQRPQGATLAGIVAGLELPRTTALRIVTTLEHEGFVRRDDRHYFVGPALIPLGVAAQAKVELRSIALPFMQQAVEATGETCHLAVPFEDKSMIVEAVQSPHPLTASSRTGSLVDLVCSASGKVFLAYLHEHDFAQLVPVEKLVARTPNSILTHQRLAQELTATRTRAYALDEEEYFTGVRCVAVPIWSSRGVEGALGLTASAHRLTPERVPTVAASLQKIASRISERIGGPAVHTAR
ncbi:MAG: IclR family transcriptional regulator [Verrucomicrobiota bacterium JB022]|nr:IclR family transcriptional regulator [Verrucomicrobiota bacterium JB022]